MMNGGHWDLQRRLMALLSASEVVLERGGACMCGCWGRGCVKFDLGKVDNETAGLVITMGHGEGREQAGSVNEVRMAARDRLDLT